MTGRRTSSDTAKAGEAFFLEVMKTEVSHVAPCDGSVMAVAITEGQEGVDAGAVAVTIG